MANPGIAVRLTTDAAGFAGTCVLLARKYLEPQVKQIFQKSAFCGSYYRGGFEPKMTKWEAALTVSISPTANKGKKKRCSSLNYALKSPRRRISFIRQPKLDEGKDSLEGQIKKLK
jgi:DnaJ family protein C protein 19